MHRYTIFASEPFGAESAQLFKRKRLRIVIISQHTEEHQDSTHYHQYRYFNWCSSEWPTWPNTYCRHTSPQIKERQYKYTGYTSLVDSLGHGGIIVIIAYPWDFTWLVASWGPNYLNPRANAIYPHFCEELGQFQTTIYCGFSIWEKRGSCCAP